MVLFQVSCIYMYYMSQITLNVRLKHLLTDLVQRIFLSSIPI